MREDMPFEDYMYIKPNAVCEYKDKCNYMECYGRKESRETKHSCGKRRYFLMCEGLEMTRKD